MLSKELNSEIERLIKSPLNMQEFADIASPEENWRVIDKNIPVPRGVGFAAEDCPACFDTIRLIYDKFSQGNEKLPLICPHCKAELVCVLEFMGYTSEISLEEKTDE
ncbi:MAG: hypothetical protein A2V66_15875 [Ignavibacteria bacterium RBG_13_36_8]|nr:MAG: hypothetical protein A2V66_15875 [Ignavibacteria bacterium RBG_13_36_8]